MWAEDGAVFISQALAPDQPWTPFRPYDGYLHLVPRLAAEIVVRFFDADNYAAAMTVLACAAVAVVSVLTYHCARAVTANVWMRAAWAAVPVVINVGAIETLGNFANFHWYLLWLALWLLIKPARSIPGSVGLFLVAAVASLTEIISIALVPLFLFRFKDKAYWPARAGLALGLACQVYTTLSYPRRSNGGYELDPLSIVYGWFINTAVPIVYGTSRNAVGQILNFGAWPVVLAALMVAGVVAAIMWRGTRGDRWLALLFVAASVLVWTACLVANPAGHLDYARFTDADWQEQFQFSRYSVAPTMFLLALGPILASMLRRVSMQASAVALSAFGLLLVSMYFPPATFRDNGPLWRDSVATAKDLCRASPGIGSVDVPVAPHYYQGKVAFPCAVLLADKQDQATP